MRIGLNRSSASLHDRLNPVGVIASGVGQLAEFKSDRSNRSIFANQWGHCADGELADDRRLEAGLIMEVDLCFHIANFY
tara:strand:- start:14429 stop:14665 length:237 start_codon:yes stop_codon:yes gene_type:complete